MNFQLPIIVSHRLALQRRVESDGFYQGAHGVPADPGLEEIDANFKKKSAELEHQSVVRQKSIEAKLEHILAQAPHAEALLAAVRKRIGDRMPQLALPLLIAGIGMTAVLAEALLLAPAMDVLNVTDPSAQLFSALGISGVTALAFHFAWESFTSGDHPRVWKLACRMLAVLLACGLVCWGILRGFQVGFAASLSHNPLGAFLADHPVLSSIFYIFITLATPVMAATASHYASGRLHDWWEWSSSGAEAKRLSKLRTTLTKQLESERETLIHGLKALGEERREWAAAYKQHHHRGTRHGAEQEPYWTVMLRAMIATIFAMVVLGWLVVLVSPFFGLIVPMVWLWAFLYYRRRWKSPGPGHFYDLERVQFVSRDPEVIDGGRKWRVQQ